MKKYCYIPLWAPWVNSTWVLSVLTGLLTYFVVISVSILSNQEILLTSNIITIAGLSTVLYCVNESQVGRFRGSGLRAPCSVWEARAQPLPWIRIGLRKQSWTHRCAPPKMSFSCSFKNKSSKSKCKSSSCSGWVVGKAATRNMSQLSKLMWTNCHWFQFRCLEEKKKTQHKLNVELWTSDHNREQTWCPAAVNFWTWAEHDGTRLSLVPPSGGRDRHAGICLRPVWTTQWAPGQSGLRKGNQQQDESRGCLRGLHWRVPRWQHMEGDIQRPNNLCKVTRQSKEPRRHWILGESSVEGTRRSSEVCGAPSPLCFQPQLSSEMVEEKLGVVLKQMIIKPCFKFPWCCRLITQAEWVELSPWVRETVLMSAGSVSTYETGERRADWNEQEEQWRGMLWRQQSRQPRRKPRAKPSTGGMMSGQADWKGRGWARQCCSLCSLHRHPREKRVGRVKCAVSGTLLMKAHSARAHLTRHGSVRV